MKRLIGLLMAIGLAYSCSKEIKTLPDGSPGSAATLNEPAPTNCVCTKPTGLVTTNVSATTASFTWDRIKCGSITLAYRVVGTTPWTFVNNITQTGVSISGLQRCTNYEVRIYHNGTNCSSAWTNSLFFTTAGPCYCSSTGVAYANCSIQHLSWFALGLPTIFFGNTPVAGYVDSTELTISLAANTLYAMATGYCYGGLGSGTMYWKLWIDYNNNGVFDASELVISRASFNNYSGALGCQDTVLPDMTTPSGNICQVRARYSISYNFDQGPCSTIPTGHVVDFKVNVGNCFN